MCEPINNDIVPKLDIGPKQLVSTGSGQSLHECHKLCW